MMHDFATLLERLVLTPQRNGKLRLLLDFFTRLPDPERGMALSAITGELRLDTIKPAMLRSMVEQRVDGQLFALSYDFVGDLAETIALIWPESHAEAASTPLSLADIITTLQQSSRRETPALVAQWLDRLAASERYALIKLITGGMRAGVSARLAKQALALFGNRPVSEIEEVWHGLQPPYESLFAWLEGKAPPPQQSSPAPFRAVMLAHALEEKDLADVTPETFAAEWKWDGIRVQAVSDGETRRLYSRSGDDISASFPDIVEAMDFAGAIDGELLVGKPGDATLGAAAFSQLQQRLNRKSVTARQLRDYPAFIRAYDLLWQGDPQHGEDLRPLPYDERRRRLQQFAGELDPSRFDLSPPLDFADLDDLRQLRANPPVAVIEGVMLKRRDSAYVAGRPKGPWFKWKRDPFSIDAVLVYAQRGHGKRSGYFSDFTFAVWSGAGEQRVLVPVGKAYFGFTDAELQRLDRFVRDNTIERFGPVRSLRAEPQHGFVVEVAFEGLNRSSRHKSGVAMRFPRIARLRDDKQPADADHLDALLSLLHP